MFVCVCLLVYIQKYKKNKNFINQCSISNIIVIDDLQKDEFCLFRDRTILCLDQWADNFLMFQFLILVHNATVTAAVFAPNPSLFVRSKRQESDPSKEIEETPRQVMVTADFTGAIKVVLNLGPKPT